jgi:indolepyruvate ferredoxin oxidoreductase beta subunit
MRGTTDIVICGVGGQGVVLASKVLAAAALMQGFDVKASEVHGMAQRGGSVVSQVRFGEKVFAPTISDGHAAMMLAFEELEALRNTPLMIEGASIVLNTQKIDPLPVVLKKEAYPGDVAARLKASGFRVSVVNGLEELKTKNFPPKALNIFLLGVASKSIPVKEENFLKAVEQSVPQKYVDVNKQVFQAGRSLSL